jgi:hypothetical protein
VAAAAAAVAVAVAVTVAVAVAVAVAAVVAGALLHTICHDIRSLAFRLRWGGERLNILHHRQHSHLQRRPNQLAKHLFFDSQTQLGLAAVARRRRLLVLHHLQISPAVPFRHARTWRACGSCMPAPLQKGLPATRLKQFGVILFPSSATKRRWCLKGAFTKECKVGFMLAFCTRFRT